MIEDKNQKKNKVIKGIALLGLFLMVFGITYAIFQITLQGKKKVKINTGNLSVKIENESPEDGVILTNAIPESEEAGLKEDAYTFDLVNDGNIEANYKLYIKMPLKDTFNWEDDNINYYMTKDSGELNLPQNLSAVFSGYNDFETGAMSSKKEAKVKKLGTGGGFAGDGTAEMISRYSRGFLYNVSTYQYNSDGSAIEETPDKIYGITYYCEEYTIEEDYYSAMYINAEGNIAHTFINSNDVHPGYGYKDVQVYSNEEGSYALYPVDEGLLQPGERHSYSLQAWLNLSAGNDMMNKTYVLSTYVEAIQTIK